VRGAETEVKIGAPEWSLPPVVCPDGALQTVSAALARPISPKVSPIFRTLRLYPLRTQTGLVWL